MVDLPVPVDVEAAPMLGEHRQSDEQPRGETEDHHVPVLDLFGHRQESLLDIGSVLRRSFKERNRQCIRKFLYNT